MLVNSCQSLAARAGIMEMLSGDSVGADRLFRPGRRHSTAKTQDESKLSAYLALCHYTLPALYTLTEYESTLVVRLERQLFYVVDKYCKAFLVLLKDQFSYI